MKNRALGGNMEEMNRKRNFVKEVFVAIDEDGSGTMD